MNESAKLISFKTALGTTLRCSAHNMEEFTLTTYICTL